jgi:hypothetical protein
MQAGNQRFRERTSVYALKKLKARELPIRITADSDETNGFGRQEITVVRIAASAA